MTRRREPAPEGDGGHRVSQNAPAFRSSSVRAWDDALSDPKARQALDEGLADAEAGRTRPWSEVRRRSTSK